MNSRGRLLFGVLLLAMAVPAYSAVTDTDAKEIMSILDTVERAMETRDMNMFMSVFDPAFGDTGLNYEHLKMTMMDSFRTFSNIQIEFFNAKISIAPKGCVKMTDEFVVEKEYKPKNKKLRNYGKDEWVLKKDEQGRWKIVGLKTEILE